MTPEQKELPGDSGGLFSQFSFVPSSALSRSPGQRYMWAERPDSQWSQIRQATVVKPAPVIHKDVLTRAVEVRTRR